LHRIAPAAWRRVDLMPGFKPTRGVGRRGVDGRGIAPGDAGSGAAESDRRRVIEVRDDARSQRALAPGFRRTIDGQLLTAIGDGMRQSSLRTLLVTLAMTLLSLGPSAVSAVQAATCGDSVGPCSCGDTVITSTKLGATDPILSTTCPDTGLIVDPFSVPTPGLTLEIAGTLRGSGRGFGIQLARNADHVVITTGHIVGYDVGVGAFNLATNSEFSRLDISDAGAGIELREGSDGNIVANNTISASRTAISVSGDRNEVRQNRTDGAGIVAQLGIGNIVSRNICKDASVCYTIAGDSAVVDRNRSQGNTGTRAFSFFGVFHTVTQNSAESGQGDGFFVQSSFSKFIRNRSNHNAGVGIVGQGFGNEYTDNRCTGNGEASSPPGLC